MTARVIAIDGPAGSGKGTAARGVAEALGYAWVDTGAIYRTLALASGRQGIDWDDGEALGQLAAVLGIAFSWDGARLTVTLDGEDVSEAIRTPEMGHGASAVSRHRPVRAALLDLQRSLAADGGVVMDGRDIGTVVLPEADLKVYLVASVDERARRRADELRAKGDDVDTDAIREAIEARDTRDASRSVAPLKVARDAIVVDTTDVPPAEVVARLVGLARGDGVVGG